MTPPDKTNELDDWIDEAVLKPAHWKVDDYFKAKTEIQAREAEAYRRGQQNGVAWVIKKIDQQHMYKLSASAIGIDIGDADKVYKGMKNRLRDLFKQATGVDPAPKYPVKADLQQPNGEEAWTSQ